MSKRINQYPRVVLVGRTNVGKSTLFKRLTNTEALISASAHTTRDSKEAQTMWNGKDITIIDTGGYDISNKIRFHEHVTNRSLQEIQKADCVVLVTDQQDQLLISEVHFVKELRKKHLPVIIAINKCDRPNERVRLSNKKILGFQTTAVSSVNGGGVGDLLDQIISAVANTKPQESDTEKQITVSLIGRTNVGKSALFNALCHEEKAIVSSKDHTTRESQSIELEHQGIHITLTDTVGKRKKHMNALDRMSQRFTHEAIQEADVCVLVVEAGGPIANQDLVLAEEVLDKRRSLLIVANKWDILPVRTPISENKERKRIAHAFKSFPFVPICVASATQKLHIKRILDMAIAVAKERSVELTEDQLKNVWRSLREHITSVYQTGVNPPTFVSFSTKKSVPEAINSIIHKKIRDEHPYIGTPLVIAIEKRNRRNAMYRRPGQSG